MVKENDMKVFWLSLLRDTPKRGYWDQGLLEDLLKDFESFEVDILPTIKTIDTFGIVVIPARSHYRLVKEINKELNKLSSCILILTGDEESSFPVDKIKHNNIKIWVQNPKPDLNDKYRKLGCGYPPQIKEFRDLPNKKLDFFFAGQITHGRRKKCVKALKNLDKGSVIETEGFTQGIKQQEYYKEMANSKTAPCPSGPVTVDTFRLFEALELGCIPVADNETSKKDWSGFWNWIFESIVPFPTINDYSDLPGYIQDCVGQYPRLNNKVQAWWFRYKSKLYNKIINDIIELTGENVGSNISVIVPVSPIKSHPKTKVLEETIKSIRHHLPNSEIIITFDGVREEQEGMRNNYEEHIRRVLWLSRFWGKVTPYIFEDHKHQSGMMREIIDKVKTQTVLYVEQDTPLVIDQDIDWELVTNKILSGESNVIRFHHESSIPKEHRSLIIGSPENSLLKTVQWSQRPHLASTAFYKRVMVEQFSEESNCFLEDLIHGRVLRDWLRFSEQGWNQWRLHIYYPGENIQRSYHTDGRKGAKKYDTNQIW